MPHLGIEFGIRPRSFDTSSGSWTLACGDDTLTVAPGDSGLTAIQIGHRDFQDFINDLATLDILCTMERARPTRGTQDDIEGWWAVIRSLVDGRPMYTRGSVQMLDRDGRNLDLSRSFTSDDDDAGIGHFLAEEGFLHLSGWFDAGQMAEISADMDRELAKGDARFRVRCSRLMAGCSLADRSPRGDRSRRSGARPDPGQSGTILAQRFRRPMATCFRHPEYRSECATSCGGLPRSRSQ